MKENIRKKWETIIQSQSTSGLPIKKYCESNGISEKTFYRYKKDLHKQDPVFKPVRVKQEKNIH